MKILTGFSIFIACCSLAVKFHEQGHGPLMSLLVGYAPLLMYIGDIIFPTD